MSLLISSQWAKWTFMVYLDGDNDLEWAGDFIEMASVGSDVNINIGVQFDPEDDTDHQMVSGSGSYSKEVEL